VLELTQLAGLDIREDAFLIVSFVFRDLIVLIWICESLRLFLGEVSADNLKGSHTYILRHSLVILRALKAIAHSCALSILESGKFSSQN